MKVLIVDTSIQIVERLEEMLSVEGSIRAIYGAVSYEKSIKLFNEIKPDLILLDINLPDRLSFKLLKEIKNSNYKTYVIVLLYNSDLFILDQLKTAGVDFQIDKYNDFEKLPGIIHSIASNKKKGFTDILFNIYRLKKQIK
ncbi:MAG: response regulator [Bacteroidota bacterium]|nr:response regulator [Bacteroidota bacterium]